jgi:polysaccharide deacetylase 2 family uncharacterized protein YibQ
MAKRKTTKANNSSKILLYTAWGLALIALVLSSFVAGYYFGVDDTRTEAKQTQSVEKEKRLALLKKIEESAKKSKEKEESVNKRLQEVLKKESINYVSASHEVEDDSLANPPEQSAKEIKLTTSKPRLTIIIDDVGTASQVKAIKSLKIPLTMSFLPPSPRRPNTPKLAAKESIYMVHLPMEAQNFSAEEPFTLRVNDSQELITDRVTEIKRLFPKVEYINNHTGSKFTANETAMNRLVFALNRNHINFIDSRTTAQTQAPTVLKNFGLNYVARDVFLDHHMEKDYVLGQIKIAIKVAKSHGSAIAIGHPHKNTLQALYESKKLLKEVDLVYINRL